jgi:ABC-2 type transport system ATP-binding protein
VDPDSPPDARSTGVDAIRASRIVSRSIENVVEVENLVVRYGRGQSTLTAVDGVSFTARAGLVTAVLGPNGAGKTSTIEVCEGLRTRTSGAVRVLGHDPARRSERRDLLPRMGVMLQEGGVYPSARPIDVVRQFCGLYRRRGHTSPDPRELVELVGLTERQRTPWRRLSGGEKQRLSLALALVSHPDVVFLDEPTSGVDVNGRDTIRSIIRSLTDRGCGVILATHELDEAEKVSDRVVIFDHGRVLVEGSLDDVRKARQAVRLRTVRPLVLHDMPANIADWLVEVEPGHYTIEDAPQGLVAALAVWLSEHGIDVIELRAGLASLEDVFKKLTGERT